MRFFNWYYKQKIRKLNPEEIFSDTYREDHMGGDNYDGVISMPINKWGIYFMILFCISFCFLFLYKAYSLQIAQYESFREKSFRNNYAGLTIPSVRGSILDRNGEVLANTTKLSTTSEQYSRVYTQRAGLGGVLGFVSYPKKDKAGNYHTSQYLKANDRAGEICIQTGHPPDGPAGSGLRRACR